jgi:hypothetical protein
MTSPYFGLASQFSEQTNGMAKWLLDTASFIMENFVTMAFNHGTHKPGLFFEPKCGSDMFLRNSGYLPMHCIVLYPKKHHPNFIDLNYLSSAIP